MEADEASGSEASGWARSPSYDSVAAEAEAAEAEAAAAEEQAAGVQAQAAGEPACVGAARDAREAAHRRWGMQPADEAASCASCGFDACEPR